MCNKLNLTEEEKNIIITELAERMKDIVYINAKEEAKKALNNILTGYVTPTMEIEITYKIKFILNDILQMLGRIRRQKEGEV